MTKRLTKHGNSLAIVIDKPILEMLKITDKSNLEMRVEDGELIISIQQEIQHSSGGCCQHPDKP